MAEGETVLKEGKMCLRKAKSCGGDQQKGEGWGEDRRARGKEVAWGGGQVVAGCCRQLYVHG